MSLEGPREKFKPVHAHFEPAGGQASASDVCGKARPLRGFRQGPEGRRSISPAQPAARPGEDDTQ